MTKEAQTWPPRPIPRLWSVDRILHRREWPTAVQDVEVAVCVPMRQAGPKRTAWLRQPWSAVVQEVCGWGATRLRSACHYLGDRCNPASRTAACRAHGATAPAGSQVRKGRYGACQTRGHLLSVATATCEETVGCLQRIASEAKSVGATVHQLPMSSSHGHEVQLGVAAPAGLVRAGSPPQPLRLPLCRPRPSIAQRSARTWRTSDSPWLSQHVEARARRNHLVEQCRIHWKRAAARKVGETVPECVELSNEAL